MSDANKRGFFSRLGNVLDGVRRWTLNLFFLVFIGLLLFNIVNAFRVEVPNGGVLVLAPEGVVVELSLGGWPRLACFSRWTIIPMWAKASCLSSSTSTCTRSFSNPSDFTDGRSNGRSFFISQGEQYV